MAASKEARQECSFEIGDVIEHRSSVVGIRGAWFLSKIMDVSRGETAASRYLHVHYLDFNDEMHTVRLYDSVPSQPDKRSDRALMARPDPPHHYVVARGTSTSQPPRQGGPKLYFHRTRKFAVGDAVDAMYTNCWWEGHIKSISGNDVTVAFAKPPRGEGDVQIIHNRSLRPTLDWNNDTWTIAPGKAALPLIGVFEDASGRVIVDNSLEGQPEPPEPGAQQQLEAGLLSPKPSRSPLPTSPSGSKADVSSRASSNQRDVSKKNAPRKPKTTPKTEPIHEADSDPEEEGAQKRETEREEGLFPNMTDDDVIKGFETLLGSVPRATHPGVQRLGLRGFFKQKVAEMHAGELFPAHPPAAETAGARARETKNESGESLASSNLSEEGKLRGTLPVAPAERVEPGEAELDLGRELKDLKGSEKGDEGEEVKGTEEKQKEVEGKQEREAVQPHAGEKRGRGRPKLTEEARAKKRLGGPADSVGATLGVSHGNGGPKRRNLERGKAEAGVFLSALLARWEGVHIDEARLVFSELNEWAPSESTIKGIHGGEIKDWYRAKVERMRASGTRFVRIVSQTTKQLRYAWQPWGDARFPETLKPSVHPKAEMTSAKGAVHEGGREDAPGNEGAADGDVTRESLVAERKGEDTRGGGSGLGAPGAEAVTSAADGEGGEQVKEGESEETAEESPPRGDVRDATAESEGRTERKGKSETEDAEEGLMLESAEAPQVGEATAKEEVPEREAKETGRKKHGDNAAFEDNATAKGEEILAGKETAGGGGTVDGCPNLAAGDGAGVAEVKGNVEGIGTFGKADASGEGSADSKGSGDGERAAEGNGAAEMKGSAEESRSAGSFEDVGGMKSAERDGTPETGSVGQKAKKRQKKKEPVVIPMNVLDFFLDDTEEEVPLIEEQNERNPGSGREPERFSDVLEGQTERDLAQGSLAETSADGTVTSAEEAEAIIRPLLARWSRADLDEIFNIFKKLNGFVPHRNGNGAKRQGTKSWFEGLFRRMLETGKRYVERKKLGEKKAVNLQMRPWPTKRHVAFGEGHVGAAGDVQAEDRIAGMENAEVLERGEAEDSGTSGAVIERGEGKRRLKKRRFGREFVSEKLGERKMKSRKLENGAFVKPADESEGKESTPQESKSVRAMRERLEEKIRRCGQEGLAAEATERPESAGAGGGRGAKKRAAEEAGVYFEEERKGGTGPTERGGLGSARDFGFTRKTSETERMEQKLWEGSGNAERKSGKRRKDSETPRKGGATKGATLPATCRRPPRGQTGSNSKARAKLTFCILDPQDSAATSRFRSKNPLGLAQRNARPRKTPALLRTVRKSRGKAVWKFLGKEFRRNRGQVLLRLLPKKSEYVGTALWAGQDKRKVLGSAQGEDAMEETGKLEAELAPEAERKKMSEAEAELAKGEERKVEPGPAVGTSEKELGAGSCAATSSDKLTKSPDSGGKGRNATSADREGGPLGGAGMQRRTNSGGEKVLLGKGGAKKRKDEVSGYVRDDAKGFERAGETGLEDDVSKSEQSKKESREDGEGQQYEENLSIDAGRGKESCEGANAEAPSEAKGTKEAGEKTESRKAGLLNEVLRRDIEELRRAAMEMWGEDGSRKSTVHDRIAEYEATLEGTLCEASEKRDVRETKILRKKVSVEGQDEGEELNDVVSRFIRGGAKLLGDAGERGLEDDVRRSNEIGKLSLEAEKGQQIVDDVTICAGGGKESMGGGSPGVRAEAKTTHKACEKAKRGNQANSCDLMTVEIEDLLRMKKEEILREKDSRKGAVCERGEETTLEGKAGEKGDVRRTEGAGEGVSVVGQGDGEKPEDTSAEPEPEPDTGTEVEVVMEVSESDEAAVVRAAHPESDQRKRGAAQLSAERQTVSPRL
ncbi:hypothetical protein KFL_002460060 [Klebsormidium nitens]|uniref:Agenet domain-containing protein n=1 Tax=Klebsormidium nitens TaxID=105231 RepID=A0A1Y1I878_KLENI|nr:hypothetical protein KFL_002460060 [Klebsormidium nitens]|eukprot:GAQ85629.1 hypothetical protein KFL_002460060 [Klebsormidium nitens]